MAEAETLTRIMYDAANGEAGIPDDAAMVAGYVDGNFQSFARLVERFPAALHVPITVWPGDNVGLVLDVETGDASPEQAPSWVEGRRVAGVAFPWVYCNRSTWPAVRQAFQVRGQREPLYWIADYADPPDPSMIPEAIGHQYGGNPTPTGPYDVSVMADVIPGLDPDPVPPIPPVPPDPIIELMEDDMTQLKAARVIYSHPGFPGHGGQLALLEDPAHGRYSSWLRSTPMLVAFDAIGAVDLAGGDAPHIVGDEVFETFPPGKGSVDPRSGNVVKKWA